MEAAPTRSPPAPRRCCTPTHQPFWAVPLRPSPDAPGLTRVFRPMWPCPLWRMDQAPPLEQTFERVTRLAVKLGRIEALKALLAGIREGGDVITLIEAMLAYERMAMDAEDARRWPDKERG